MMNHAESYPLRSGEPVNGLLLRGERRSCRRYPIAVNLEYRVVRGSEVTCTGNGRTINLSTGGVLFEAAQALPEGCDIEVLVAWPALLDNEIALNLCIAGRVAWSSGFRSAVRVVNHEFCLRGRYRLSGRRFSERSSGLCSPKCCD